MRPGLSVDRNPVRAGADRSPGAPVVFGVDRLPAAAVHSIADFVADKIALGALKPLDGGAKNNLITEVIKRIGITGAKEVPPEEIQTIAERFGASLSLTDAEALKEYVNTAAAAFGMSVVPGGVGGVRTWAAGKYEDKVKTDKENEDKLTNSGITQQAVEDVENTIQEKRSPELLAKLERKYDDEGNLLEKGAADVTQQIDTTAGGAEIGRAHV